MEELTSAALRDLMRSSKVRSSMLLERFGPRHGFGGNRYSRGQVPGRKNEYLSAGPIIEDSDLNTVE